MATANTFADPANTFGTLNGLFKETYGDSLKNLIPDGVKLQNMIDFVSKEKLSGNLYNQPVILGLEQGVTFASSDEDAFNLAAPISGQIKNAQIKGNPMVLRSLVGYSAISRAMNKASFMEATKYVVSNMLRSLAKKLEIELFYGQMGYGTVASTAALVITITTAEWAPGIWAGARNMPIQIRDSSGATIRGSTVVTGVDMDLRTVSVSAMPAGVVATDVIWFDGAYGNEFAGVHKILTQSTGTLFGINVADYELFRGNQFSASSAALSFNKLNLATARAVEKGLDGKVVAFINPRAWSNLLNNEAALRQYDVSYSTERLKNGSKSLMFYAQNGDIEIQASIYVKEGYAYLLYMEDWARVGSSDLSFKLPGAGPDQFLQQSPNAAALELRLWSDQALFTSSPGKNVVITNIVNAST